MRFLRVLSALEKETLYLEVKRPYTEGEQVILTKNEVAHPSGT